MHYLTDPEAQRRRELKCYNYPWCPGLGEIPLEDFESVFPPPMYGEFVVILDAAKLVTKWYCRYCAIKICTPEPYFELY